MRTWSVVCSRLEVHVIVVAGLGRVVCSPLPENGVSIPTDFGHHNNNNEHSLHGQQSMLIYSSDNIATGT